MITYLATIGNKYQIQRYSGYVELRLDHVEILSGKVYFNDKHTLRIETTLSYDVGQKVSIGGYPIGGKLFALRELSITDNPILDDAEIIERKEN